MAQQSIKGIVIDIGTKEPLPGATVKTPTGGTVTNLDGEFSITTKKGEVIVFSYIGFTPQKYTVKGNEKTLRIEMMEETNTLEDVVVEAGIIKRDRMGFTGAFTSINQEELKAVGSINVLQSLKSLDPSFVQIENNLTGSNPNSLGTFEMRGQTTMGITALQDEANTTAAANQPLFILDGFEATLQQINDLDINRVASITLLKDAGSTAIYGSKGANGVVVIETLRPKEGRIFISYNGDYQLAAADLSVYNMMNAREKLEFEKLAGRFSDDMNTPTPKGSGQYQELYFKRLEMIAEGVDSYWLIEPIRTALTHKQSVMASGGQGNMLFDAGINYQHTMGVMKGSDREAYGANLRLVYRGINNLSIQNNIFVQGISASEGTWGSFSSFVNANPYYAKRNADGSISKYLDSDFPGVEATANPLFNAMLSSRYDTKTRTITNNTSMDWNINHSLMMRANLSIGSDNTRSINYTDPRHTRYDNVTYDKKGEYRGTTSSAFNYDFNVTLNYFQSFSKHNITAIGRFDIAENSSVYEGYAAEGFSEGSVGYPSSAFGYAANSKPLYGISMSRMLGILGAFNYNYNYRYLLDINYNNDGSTRFGQNKRFQSFWSVGAGWNVHREKFAKEWKWLNNLKLRATYGTNGNQNAMVRNGSIYQYVVGNNIFGQSAYLESTGNPDLQWQVVKKLSAGVDLEVFKRLTLYFDVYRNLTNPQIIELEQRLSTGVGTYALNMGWLRTEGMEFRANYRIINKKDLFLSARLTGAVVKSVYGGFNDELYKLNQAYQTKPNSETSLLSLQRYEDGRSPYDIWAVRSLGIDPATGDEIFLDKTGKPTKIYTAADRVVIAGTRPDIQGVFGINLRYKKLSLNSSLRYSLGAYAYNSALFMKVENITSSGLALNQDRRALYDRWKNPGDQAAFISIRSIDARTPVSSRFIQKDNYLRGESMKIQWNFTGEKWLKTFGLEDFSAACSMQDFFNLTSIRMERGIDYPFQRSVMLNVSARF